MIDVAMTDGSGGDMPDLSHLSAEERLIIEQVLQRQRAEEQKEEEISQLIFFVFYLNFVILYLFKKKVL